MRRFFLMRPPGRQWAARSDISQYLELVDGRLIVKDPATLPKEALSAIRSLREHVTDRGHRTIEVQLWDKVAARGLLARATGLHASRAGDSRFLHPAPSK